MLDEYGRSPLHYAACDADFEKAKSLLENGAEVSLQDAQGWTPLHFAAQSNSIEIASLLLAHGADIDLFDGHGNTALSRAVFESRGRGEMILLLRNAGADPTQKNRHGMSPVELARTIANFDVAQYFVDVPLPSSDSQSSGAT